VRAFEIEFGVRNIDTDWSTYPHTTERSLTAEILRRAGIAAGEPELERHRRTFVSLLESRAQEFVEIAGARAFLDELMRRGWRVGLATGAWSQSARVKLRAAGFSDALPLSCCDAAETREAIVQGAIASAGGKPPIVLFGDAPWDVRTAGALRLPIIGLGTRAIGATAHLADYADLTRALSVLQAICDDVA
jgi:phosphoglycolate phosphatase-like HAD superfamily hydrolase